MAKLVFGMNQSLDGVIDHTAFMPDAVLFRHFIGQTANLTGSIYGRVMYEVMRYWDDERTDWDDAEREFAQAWRRQPKWVVSRTLTEVGPNATLIRDDVVGAVRTLKSEHEGEIDVAGPTLAHALGQAGLIDEYRIYLHPCVIGAGKQYFAGARPSLHLVAGDRIGDDVIRLAYVPAGNAANSKEAR